MTIQPDKWISFYMPYLGEDDATRLVTRCQSGPPSNVAKLALYQTTRLVSLGEDVLTLRPGRESLCLLFLMICAEHVAKLAAGYSDDGQSRRFTKDFFRQHADPGDIDRLSRAFGDVSHHRLTWEQGIDLLYDVRCDVVHEGRYWEFSFRDGDTPMLSLERPIIAYITLDEFKALVVRTAARAVWSLLAAV